MNSAARAILYIAVGTGVVSMCYFLSLVAHIPVFLLLPILTAGLVYLFRWLEKPGMAVKEEQYGKLAFTVLFTGIVIITNKIYYLVPKYGEWDAWAIWNFHAKYLADAQHWQKLFLNTYYTHTDYPLAVPSAIAFISRMLPGNMLMYVSYGFHVLITVCVPVLIFAVIYPRGKIVACAAFLLMATNEFYLGQGISQYADTLLAFFFLCAFITIRYHYDKRMIALTAFLLGCCIWTKNEGIVLAGIFFLFYCRVFLYRSNVRYFLSGIALPILAWGVFKLFYAPANDIVAGQGSNTWAQVFEWGRYSLTYDYFMNNLNAHFKLFKYAVVIYLAFCILRRKNPEKQLLILLACCGAYAFVYIITPRDLEWHLYTSQSRLMHQLMPAAMYVLAICFSREEGGTKGFQAINFSIRRRHP